MTGARRCGLVPRRALVALLELRQHLAAEQLEALHDVLVAVLARLRREDHLVDAALLVAAQVLAHLLGRADRAAQPADARPARPWRRGGRRSRRPPRRRRGRSPARRGAAGTPPTRRSRRAGGGRTRSSARASSRRSWRPRRRGAIASSSSWWHMNGRDARDVRVDRVADRDAFVGERRVVVVHPVPRLLGVDEREGERADALLRREMDRLAAAARHPDAADAAAGAASARRCAAACVTYLPAWPVNGVSVRQRSATRRPSSHIARFSVGSTRKPPSSASRRRLAGAEVDPAARDEVERRDALGDPRRVVERRRRLHDAVTEADALRALRHRGEEHLGRARVASTPRGSGARPPRRSRCRARRRARSARARPG